MADTDDVNNDLKTNGLNMNDVLTEDETSPLHVVIDRPQFTTTGLHERYRYHPVNRPSVKAVVATKISTCRCELESLKSFLLYIFPFLDWLPKYDLRGNLLGDLMAGLIVGIVNIPQSMAFSLLAGLPPVYGLYTAFFSPFAFFIMGSSRHSSIGTFGVVSILARDAVEKIIARDFKSTTPVPVTGEALYTSSSIVTSFENVTAFNPYNVTSAAPCGTECDQRVQLHMLLCLMVGLIQVLMGIFRLGIVTTYLAQPLVRAFTTGAACHVITSQVPPLLGLSLPRYVGPLSLIYTWRDIFVNLPNTNVASLIIALIALAILAPGKYLSARYKERIKIPIPWELLVVIVTILISYFVNIEEKYGVDIVSDIPLGFPVPSVPSMTYFGDLFSDAIAIAIVGFAVSVSLAKIFAAKNDYEIESNQELLAYGASNVTSSFFSCFVSASALARVALLDDAGSKTQVAMIVSSVIVMLVLLVLGPLFEPLPKSVLAIIIIYALRGIMRQFTDLKMLYRTSKIDCSIWLVTWSSVFLLGVDLGLGVGVVYALFTVILRTQVPRVTIDGRLRGSELYRDTMEYKLAERDPGIHIFSMQSALYYANAEQFKRALYRTTGINPVKRLAGIRSTGTSADNSLYDILRYTDPNVGIHTILIDCSQFGFVDVTGVKTLLALTRDYQKIGIQTLYCSCTDSVRESIIEMGQDVDTDIFFPSVHDAVISATRKQSPLLTPLTFNHNKEEDEDEV